MRHVLTWKRARFASRILVCCVWGIGASATDVVRPEVRHTFAALWTEIAESNPSLTVAYAGREIALGETVQSAVRPNPTLELSSENVGTVQREDSISVSQALELGGKRAARMRLADQSRSFAEAAIDAARATLYAELRTAFVVALAAEAKLSLAQSALRLSARSARAIDRQIAAGDLARVAAARAGVEVANARLALTRARADWTLAGKRLANLANRPDGLISADGSLEVLSPLPSLPVLQEQLTNAPALRLAREETARRQAEVAVEVSRKVGNLTFSAGVKYLEQTDEPAGVLAMSFPLPLSDRNQGNVVRAHGAVAQAAAQERATELALRGELRDLYLRYETALATADEVRGAILPAATAALSSTEQGFKLGKFGLVDVLDTRRTLLQARLQLVDALTEAQLAQAGTIRIVGIAAGDSSPRSEELR